MDNAFLAQKRDCSRNKLNMLEIENIISHLYIFTSIFMVGLIWVVQLVHYPAFVFIEENKFKAFSKFHQRAITLIVAPVMLLELSSISYLFLMHSGYELGFLITIILWGITAYLGIFCHRKLLIHKDFQIIKKLILINWIRTALWSIKASLMVYSPYIS